ncbi:MAG TPA: glycosyltransferase 87 family protein [Gaiellaceae bacterium]|nr:glycosyltransferase 87 family protein [Gaiellaceae bacterium]
MRRAAVAALVFLACWGAVHFWFYRYDLIGDVGIYRGYAELVRHGAVPYRDFAFEYPPGALPPLLAPAYLGGYQHAFGLLMGVLGAALAALLARDAPLRGLAFAAVSPLLVGALVLNRFDLWPALLATAALLALLHDRHRLGFALLAAGFTAKLWPLLLVPLAAAWTLRRRGGRELARAGAAAAAVAAAALVPFAALAPHGLWSSLWGQLSRPLEIETLGGALLMLTGHAGIDMSHGSYNAAGVAVRPLEALTGAALATTLAVLWVAFARGPAEHERLVRYAAASVCAFVALGKVLSPQYLIWLVPLVALLRGRRGAWAVALLSAALVLTQVLYPSRFYDYVYGHRLAWLVLLRDLLLVGFVAQLALPHGVWRRRPRERLETRVSQAGG